MAVLNIGDYQIQVETQQASTPSLKLMTADGTIYYAGVKEGVCPGTLQLGDGAKNWAVGKWNLYFDVTSINSCDTVTVEPGCYRVDVKGARGGDGGNNSGSGAAGESASYYFTATASVGVTVFRGGNGVAGTVNTNGDAASGGGGGASGMASLFAFGNDVTVANGGAGGIGGSAKDNGGNVISCGGGGGGDAGDQSNGMNAAVRYVLTNDFYVCGAGGGGAASGTGGMAVSDSSYGGRAGEDASAESGGAGGTGYRILSSASGGAGGASISLSCAGRSMTSLGGGGGGGIGVRANGVNLTGGEGGSGVSDSQSDGYVKIYRYY